MKFKSFGGGVKLLRHEAFKGIGEAQSFKDVQFLLFIIYLCSVSKDNEQTGWLSNVDMPIVNPDGSVRRQVMHILFLGSVITTLREFDGLEGLSAINCHLQRAIFCANLKPLPPRGMATAQPASTNNGRTSTSDDNVLLDPHTPSRPSSLSQSFWNRICAKLNQYQAAAIETFMSGKTKENVFLLQVCLKGYYFFFFLCLLVRFLLSVVLPFFCLLSTLLHNYEYYQGSSGLWKVSHYSIVFFAYLLFSVYLPLVIIVLNSYFLFLCDFTYF